MSDNTFDLEDEDFGTEDFMDNFDYTQQGNQDDEAFENVDDDDDPAGDGEHQNTVLSSYLSWAEANGIAVDKDKLNPETFTREEMDKLVGKHYATKYYGNVDPKLIEMSEQGISMEDYIRYQTEVKSIIALPDEKLVKSDIYSRLVQQYADMKMVKTNDKGELTEESRNMLISETERMFATMSKEMVSERGADIKKLYTDQLDKLPEEVMAKHKEKVKSQIDRYRSEVDQFAASYKANLSKMETLVIPFSGQSEKDDFLKYMTDNINYVEQDGQTVIPLLHKLQNDDEFLARTLRLLHMYDNGYFTDMTNKARKETFEKLQVTPVVGGKGSATGGGKKMDTSHKDYQKHYLKNKGKV